MRVQLSFEFLLYLGIAMASMVVMIAFYSKASTPLSSFSAQGEFEDFVAGVNANFGIAEGSFDAYLPKEACTLRVTNNTVSYMGQSYWFYGNISLELAGRCPGFELLHTSMLLNGTMLVS